MTLTSGKSSNLGYGHFPKHLAYKIKIMFPFYHTNSAAYVGQIFTSLATEANNVEADFPKALIASIKNGDQSFSLFLLIFIPKLVTLTVNKCTPILR